MVRFSGSFDDSKVSLDLPINPKASTGFDIDAEVSLLNGPAKKYLADNQFKSELIEIVNRMASHPKQQSGEMQVSYALTGTGVACIKCKKYHS